MAVKRPQRQRSHGTPSRPQTRRKQTKATMRADGSLKLPRGRRASQDRAVDKKDTRNKKASSSPALEKNTRTASAKGASRQKASHKPQAAQPLASTIKATREGASRALTTGKNLVDPAELQQRTEQLRHLARHQVPIGKDKRNTVSVGLIAAMIALLLVFVAPPTFTYISTYQQAVQLRYQVRQAHERHVELEDELARWGDKEFIESQARQRLGFVKPGQTRYRVVDPDKKYVEAYQKRQTNTPDRPWYIQLQESIVKAGTANSNDTSTSVKKGTPAKGAEPVQTPDK